MSIKTVIWFGFFFCAAYRYGIVRFFLQGKQLPAACCHSSGGMDFYFAGYLCKDPAETEMVSLVCYICIGGRLYTFTGASLDGNIKY